MCEHPNGISCAASYCQVKLFIGAAASAAHRVYENEANRALQTLVWVAIRLLALIKR